MSAFRQKVTFSVFKARFANNWFLSFEFRRIQESLKNITKSMPEMKIRGSIQKFSDWVDKEIYAYKNKNLLRSKIKGYGDKTR
jgi:hypothetical protein